MDKVIFIPPIKYSFHNFLMLFSPENGGDLFSFAIFFMSTQEPVYGTLNSSCIITGWLWFDPFEGRLSDSP